MSYVIVPRLIMNKIIEYAIFTGHYNYAWFGAYHQANLYAHAYNMQFQLGLNCISYKERERAIRVPITYIKTR